jgi:uncharacterized protein (TIGR00255 family)
MLTPAINGYIVSLSLNKKVTMLQSMTGYGIASAVFKNKTIQVEIRSLNSKTTDFKIRVPNNYRDKENELRKILQDKTDRGKLDFNLDIKSDNGDDGFAINESLYKKYLKELIRINSEVGYEDQQLTQAVVRIPNVMASEMATVDELEWQAVLQIAQQAVDAFIEFRLREGESIRADMEKRCDLMSALMVEIDPYEQARTERMRTKLLQMLQTHVPEESIDRNRFEQELLYFLEKMDVTEEKTRLREHISYYLEVLNNEVDESKGRKLSFISQEMGREINTIGSKANDADIQRLVVNMKDELEKIKEQLANIV